MNYLYLILNIGAISIPLIFSFHPKLKFIRYWKSTFLAILSTTLIFIIWDIIFTKEGIWGFNQNYLLGIDLLGLPIEEWLFFICIPYACMFTHFALNKFLSSHSFSIRVIKVSGYTICIVFLLIALFNYERLYTFTNFLLASLIIFYATSKETRLLSQFIIPIAIILLIPFLLINGILTGAFIECEVVWYNNTENLNIRVGTIPIEDTVYAFSLIFLNLIFQNYFMRYENLVFTP